MRFNPDNTPDKKEAYKAKILVMTDEELFGETEKKIWLSAFAANNPISCYHWQCDDTYTEWVRRGKVDQYDRAHKRASASA